jgi:signal transduction histidine kinase
VLDDLGLAAALHTLAHRAREHAPAVDIEVIVDAAAEALAPDGVPAAAASALYRVAQESVTNALRHAHAQCLTVVLRRRRRAPARRSPSRCRTTAPASTCPTPTPAAPAWACS